MGAALARVAAPSLARYDAMCRAIDQAEALAAIESCEHTFLFPSLPGVYVFDGMGGVLYVGESRNLKKRLANHERGYLRRSVGVRCRIVPCRNHKQVERWLIAALKPSLNGVSETRRSMRADTRSFDDVWAALAPLFGASS